MIVTGNITTVRNTIRQLKRNGQTVGFVPTMGALHHGHLSLVKTARKECDFVVVSIFVNPLQFGPTEDYTKYPRILHQDRKMLEAEKTDLLFVPSPDTMYVTGFSTHVEELSLSKNLCGALRPGHFKGVCTVVAKLFNIVTPDIAYFGRKDYQQAKVITRMVRDLNFPLVIKTVPIVREKDGLAMSSRNRYLSDSERKDAVILYQALQQAKKVIMNRKERQAKKIIGIVKDCIAAQKSGHIDYISLVNAHTLEDVTLVKGDVLIAIAVYFGKTRLIDNILLKVK